MKLTKRQREVLTIMSDESRAESERELIWAKGGGWWLGDERVGAKTAHYLLRLVLIKHVYGTRDEYEAYLPYPEVKRVLNEPDYEPVYVRISRGENTEAS